MPHDIQTRGKKAPDAHKRPATTTHQTDEELITAQMHQAEAIQQANLNPGALSQGTVLQLQQVIGNQAVGRLLDRQVGMEERSGDPDQPVQRMKDKDGNIVGLDMAECSLVGIAHEAEQSFATVRSQAWMSSPEHKVLYEIKWDGAVVPGGTHLDQVANQGSDWVIDKSKDGEPIGDRDSPQPAYFNNENEMKSAQETGTFFYYNDPIQQRRLRGGSWWFRLKVVDGSDNVLSQSHAVEVDWDTNQPD